MINVLKIQISHKKRIKECCRSQKKLFSKKQKNFICVNTPAIQIIWRHFFGKGWGQWKNHFRNLYVYRIQKFKCWKKPYEVRCKTSMERRNDKWPLISEKFVNFGLLISTHWSSTVKSILHSSITIKENSATMWKKDNENISSEELLKKLTVEVTE